MYSHIDDLPDEERDSSRVAPLNSDLSNNSDFDLVAYVKNSPIAFGQVLSLLITGTGICSTLLVYNGAKFPAFQSLLNYLLLSLYFFRFGYTGTLNWYFYLGCAFVDVEANFLVVLAYQYTSIAHVMLIDCFSIPCAMFLSHYFFQTDYSFAHVVGVFICLLGIACIVVTDIHPESDAKISHNDALVGDVLCLIGATLYAISNVCQQYAVKIHSRFEYLGLLGIMSLPISAIQVSILEIPSITRTNWSNPSIILLLIGFTTCLFTMYTSTTSFLQKRDVALLNLSLLTSDVYSVLFACLAFGFELSILYLAAFLFIITGIMIYSASPSVSFQIVPVV